MLVVKGSDASKASATNMAGQEIKQETGQLADKPTQADLSGNKEVPVHTPVKVEAQTVHAGMTQAAEVLNMEIDFTCASETEERSTTSDQASHHLPSLHSDSASRQESITEQEPVKDESPPPRENLPTPVSI